MRVRLPPHHVGDLDDLALKEIDVGFEIVSRPHLHGKKVMITHLGFLTSGVLFEEGLNDLREVIERARWWGVEPP